ncbi:3-dehydroquinate dehydratase [Thermococcus henrietii]|uniref:3-dehydroquinate dehydratase n=1 Tax=Thermococcus henrietii TaxID=2016361 RepID=UPI000C076584|nr:3-dehydroquinate dehydratase [Thermococcus henrietii]
MIAGVVLARDAREAAAKIEGSRADLYEVRLDHFESFDLSPLKPYAERLILTVRRAEEGGYRRIPEEERLELYRRAMELGPRYVDVEVYSGIAGEVIEEARRKKVGVILSHHDFEKTPTFGGLIGVLDDMEEMDPDVIKIVPTARELRDNVRVLRLYEQADNLVAFCMGPLGRISRLFSALLAPFTYASIDGSAAPGQMSVEELERLLVMLNGR